MRLRGIYPPQKTAIDPWPSPGFAVLLEILRGFRNGQKYDPTSMVSRFDIVTGCWPI